MELLHFLFNSAAAIFAGFLLLGVVLLRDVLVGAIFPGLTPWVRTTRAALAEWIRPK